MNEIREPWTGRNRGRTAIIGWQLSLSLEQHPPAASSRAVPSGLRRIRYEYL